MVDNSLYLKHYGVKGMKWGVRKKYYKSHMDSDRTFKKGSKFHNVSSNSARDVDSSNTIYGFHTKHDRNVYAGHYANSMRTMNEKPIINDLVAKTDIKIPSQKKAVSIFSEVYKKDPKKMSDSIGKAYADLSWFGNIKKFRNWNANRISNKIQKNVQKKGDDYLKTKGYLLFNQSLTNSRYFSAKSAYYKKLMDHGYNALSDVNDVQTGYGSDDPIIFIKPNKTLKNVKSTALSESEIDLALARYDYEEALKNNRIVDTLFLRETAKAKKNLKRVEKRQQKSN